jgi:hypothetical protein
MNTQGNTHVSFAQLPLEACALFYFHSMSAMEYHLDLPHTSAEIFSDLEKVWNANELTPDDLLDWERMGDLLLAQLPKDIPREQHFTRPESRRRRCRRQ